MSYSYTEEVVQDDETDALSKVSGGVPYVFIVADTDRNPPLIRIVCGNGPENAEDIKLILRATLNQMP